MQNTAPNTAHHLEKELDRQPKHKIGEEVTLSADFWDLIY